MPTNDWRCKKCGETLNDVYSHTSAPEQHCGEPMERLWSTSRMHHSSVYPYITKNITGEPIEVTSSAHLEQLCKKHGVTHRPDAAFIERHQVTRDVIEYIDTAEFGRVPVKRRKTELVDGRGTGMPGCWN